MFIPRGRNCKKLPGQYMAINQCQTASQVSLFVGFLIFADQLTHENHENWYPTNKGDFTVCFSFAVKRFSGFI
jgi:hypothetical protein